MSDQQKVPGSSDGPQFDRKQLIKLLSSWAARRVFHR